MSACPRCGEDIGLGQEFCLECGTRVFDLHPHGEDPGRGWVRRALVGLVVAIAGAAVAIAASGGTEDGGPSVLTATGGFATNAAPNVGNRSGSGSQAGPLEWPALEEGWTIAVATLPQAGGKRAATARAREALRSGLDTVGVLDTSRYASLHPGYWLVFTGVYGSEAEATSALPPARGFARTAVVRRVVP